jgi:hypothetical protein
MPVSGYNYRMEFIAADLHILRHPLARTSLLDFIIKADIDKKRLRVNSRLTPFKQRPEIELIPANSAGKKITSRDIIEPIRWKLDLTLLIRKIFLPADKSILTTGLIYPEICEANRHFLLTNNPVPAI